MDCAAKRHKRLLAAVTALLLAACCGCAGTRLDPARTRETPPPAQTPAPTPTPPPITPGDCNFDGVVTAADAAVLLRCVDGRALGRAALAADVTHNGALDGTDARAALWLATGQIPDPVKFVERIATGLCDESLFDRFRYTDVYDDGAGNYQSANVSVTVSLQTFEGCAVRIADIYVQDLACFATAFAKGRYRGGSETVLSMARANDAIVAVNGDFYTQRDAGPVVRNGAVYQPRVNTQWDIALLLDDGALRTLPYRTLTAEAFAGLSVWQSWVFGPALLDEAGAAKTKFRSAVTAVNPRTALGYYAPGHYAFLVADGRQRGYSAGLTMEQLSALCATLGLKSAYNLDGGRSSVMASRDGVLNRPYANGRIVSDILYIRELPE